MGPLDVEPRSVAAGARAAVGPQLKIVDVVQRGVSVMTPKLERECLPRYCFLLHVWRIGSVASEALREWWNPGVLLKKATNTWKFYQSTH